jgi:hypothetical protein
MALEGRAPSVFTLLMICMMLFGVCWRLCGITLAIGCTFSLASNVYGWRWRLGSVFTLLICMMMATFVR